MKECPNIPHDDTVESVETHCMEIPADIVSCFDG